jgi:hypothetical protein
MPADALTPTKPVRPANLSADLLAMRQLVGTMNNPEISGAKAPPIDQLMREAQAEMSAAVAATAIPAATTPQQNVPPFPSPPPTLPPPPPPPRYPRRILLTGRDGADPEAIAKRSGLCLFSIDQEISDSLKEFAGPGNEAVVSPFLSEFKAIGDGTVNQTYPLSLHRLLVVKMIREAGQPKFGTPGFWVGLMLERVSKWFSTQASEAQVMVTGVRFVADFTLLKEARFLPFHVMCSNQTASRLAVPAKTGDGLVQALDNNVMKQISQGRQGPRLRAIWNDSQPMPAPRFYTPDLFQSEVIRPAYSPGEAEMAAPVPDIVL